MSDRIHDTLTALRSDVEQASLADSAAVRRRGNQRTRRQVAGSALAAVAVVAAAVGISGALNGSSSSIDKLPPATTGPSATSSAPVSQPLDPAVLLSRKDLPPVKNQTFIAGGETLAAATAADTAERAVTVCGVSPATGGTPDSAMLRIFPSELDAVAWEWVARYTTADEATVAVSGLQQKCSDKGTRVTAGPALAAVNGFRVGSFSAQPGSEFSGEIAAVTRNGNTVVVLGLRAMIQDGDVDLTAFDAAAVTAQERVALG
jgi:hypothetical protein